jgi:hypothetical protein
MANRNVPNGFRPKNIKDADSNQYVITAGQVLAIGDLVYFDSAGTLAIGDTGGRIAGVVAGNMIEHETGETIATATAGDYCMVWDDPFQIFIAQTSSFAATDPYTTASSASCFDIVTTTGAQYINASSSTYDTIKVLRLSSEENGKKSIAGAYAKVECQINPLKHARGCTA